MNVVRQEIRTGLFVISSLVVLIGVLLYLGAPGVFVPMKTYWVYVDNAAGLKPGADVLLAGRRIGEVRRLYSPVPENTRPDKEKKMETLIEVRVDRKAEIYANVKVLVTQTSLLGETLLDFTSGSESTGFAPSGSTFLGERPPGLSEAIPKVLNTLEPAVDEATKTLKTLQATAESINKLAGPGGEVEVAITEFKKFGGNLNDLTGPGSHLRNSLENLDHMTGEDGKLGQSLENLKELTSPDGSLAKTLKNAEKFTENISKNQDIYAALRNLRMGTAKLDYTLNDLSGKFSTVGTNLSEASDTVKHQPWRLIWPNTKKYPSDGQPVAATPAPAEKTRRKKSEAR